MRFSVLRERFLDLRVDLAPGPSGLVGRVEFDTDLFEDPHLAGSGFFVGQDHPTEGRLRVTRHPIDFGPAEPDRPAPANGQHTREVLREAGLSDAEIDDLAASGAAGAASSDV